MPAWTQERPHFFAQDGRQFASAVGRARTVDPALARAAAEDRARVDLLRLLHGGTPGGSFQGALAGARMTDAFTSKRTGEVFVRLEVEANRR